ncbi:hypothetical protein KJ909_01590 [Patescibacteria group bacterium]|nr:hypothetical protein [Patescibacteria group bacterium]
MISSVGFLAIVSVWPLADFGLVKIGQLLIFLITIKFLLPFCKNFKLEGSWIDLAVIVPALILTISRFPIYYPMYDDLAYHFMAGDYGLTMWNNGNFLPMGFGTYIYPLAQMIYRPFLEILGVRLTLLLNSSVLVFWFFSINLRFKFMFRENKWKKLLIDLIFIYIFFTPHLMATHVSFMVDFLTLILGLEMLLGFLNPKSNKTLATVFGFLAMIIKQSSGIVMMPLFIYLVLKNRKKMKWGWIMLFVTTIAVYFLTDYKVTGNPIAFLYNGFFKSSLYGVANFKDARWGPQSLWEIVVWPVIGQFGLRFGEGLVNNFAKGLFSLFMIIPYLGSIYGWFRTRKIKYLLVVVSYLIWSILMGYSRYQVAFSALVLVWMVVDLDLEKMKKKLVDKFYLLLLMIFCLACVSSVSTDYAWRPHILLLVGKTRINSKYYIDKYTEGLNLVGKDRLIDLAEYHKDLYEGYDAVVPYFRGPSTFFGYIGYLNGVEVIGALDNESYERVLIDAKVDDNLKSNLRQIEDDKRILLISEQGFGDITKNLFLSKYFDCSEIETAIKSPYFQLVDYFSNVVLFDCVKRD